MGVRAYLTVSSDPARVTPVRASIHTEESETAPAWVVVEFGDSYGGSSFALSGEAQAVVDTLARALSAAAVRVGESAIDPIRRVSDALLVAKQA